MSPKRIPVKFDDDIFEVNGAYVYRGTPFGTKKRREVSLKLKVGAPQKDVLAAKKKLLEDLERGGSRGGSSSFTSLSERYISSRHDEAKNQNVLSTRTAYEAEAIIRQHLQKYFWSKRIEEIDQPMFSDYCRLKSKKLNMVNHRKVMNHFLKWCVHEGYLKYRLVLEIPKAATKPRRKRVVLTDAQIKSLIAACVADKGDRLKLYVFMYLFMGMRNMEICQLRWDEVDLKDRAIRINPMSNRRRKSRVIPINSHVFDLLKNRERVNDYVFPSFTKAAKKPFMDSTGSIRKPWDAALIRAGLTGKITPHDLRATFEKFMHTNKNFTDTQREKMAGAAIDVQKNIYVSMDASDLRGLEESVQIKGIDKILGGKRGGKTKQKGSKTRAKR
jgi:integrase